MRVLIGMPAGEQQPKWLVNAMFGLSNRIVIVGLAAFSAMNIALALHGTEPTPEPDEVVAVPPSQALPKNVLN